MDEPHRQYVVVARRYRPKSFGELVGQQQVSQALTNAIATNRVGHAYLFTGARGVGKTSTARILAKCLNCVQGPTSTPCGVCDNCESIATGEDVDVLEIDGASNRGIDEIRQLRSNVNVRPSRSRFKIYIIDEVHMLTVQAFNALLKTLEEPPDHVKFIFCTTDAEKIPITVLSRCQRFDFAPVATDSIVERLQFIVDTEGVQADPAALRLLARRAGGSMRDSQSLLEQLLAFCGNKIAESDVHTMLGTAHGSRMLAITQHVIDRNAGAALAELDAALREGVDVGQLAEQLLGYWRDMMAVLVGCRADLMLHAAAADFDALKECGERWGLETVLAAVQILDQAIVRMRQSTQVRTLVEIALVRICNLEDLDSLPALLAQFGGDGGLASASPKAPAAPKPVRRGDPPTTPVRPAAKSGPSDEASAPSPAPPPRESGNPRGQDSRTGAHGVTAAEPPRDVAAPIEIPISRVSISSVGDSDDYTEDKGNPAFEPVFELTAENAEQKWRETLTDIGGMTAEFGGNYERVAISGPNQLVVTLRAAYNKEWCERPDVKRKLETTLSRLGGRDLRIGFCVGAEPPVARPERRPTAQSMMQRRREVEQHPLVQQAMELFEAEVVRVDGPAR